MDITLDFLHPHNSPLVLTSAAYGPYTFYDHEDADGGPLCFDSGWGCAWRSCLNVMNAMHTNYPALMPQRMTMSKLQTIGNLPPKVWLDNFDMYELITRCVAQGGGGGSHQLRVTNTVFLPHTANMDKELQRLINLKYDEVGILYRGLVFEDTGVALFGKDGWKAALQAGDICIRLKGSVDPDSPFRSAQEMFVRCFDTPEELGRTPVEDLRKFWRAVVCFDKYYRSPEHTTWVRLSDPMDVGAVAPHFMCKSCIPAVVCDGTYTNNVYGTAIDISTNTLNVCYADVHGPHKPQWRKLNGDVLKPTTLLQVTHFDVVVSCVSTANPSGGVSDEVPIEVGDGIGGGPLPIPTTRKTLVMPPTKTGALYLNAVRTEVVTIAFEDKLQIIVSQMKRPAGRVYMITTDTDAAQRSPVFSVEPILGGSTAGTDAAMIESVLGRQISEHLFVQDKLRRPTVLMVALLPEVVPHSRNREWLLRLLNVILALRVW